MQTVVPNFGPLRRQSRLTQVEGCHSCYWIDRQAGRQTHLSQSPTHTWDVLAVCTCAFQTPATWENIKNTFSGSLYILLPLVPFLLAESENHGNTLMTCHGAAQEILEKTMLNKYALGGRAKEGVQEIQSKCYRSCRPFCVGKPQIR